MSASVTVALHKPADKVVDVLSGVRGETVGPQKVLGRTAPGNIGIRGRTCGYAVTGNATDVIKCAGKRDEGIKRGGGGVSKVISEIKHGDGVNARTLSRWPRSWFD